MRRQPPFLLRLLLALLLYFAVVPRLGLWLDRRLELIWRLPGWADPLAVVLIVAGAAFPVWYFWTSVSVGTASQSPSLTEPVQPRSSGRLIFAVWAAGAGLGLLLRSVSLMVLVALSAIIATVYFSRSVQQPPPSTLSKHAGRPGRRMPAWLILTVVVIGTLAGFPKISRSVVPPRVTEPAILVQIRCKPGMGELWRADFEQYLRPAIEEAVGRKDSYSSFQFLEPALPGQGFDFGLLYTGESFSGLDQPRLFPQYVALVDRLGPVRAMEIGREMGQCEEQVTVSLIHLSRTR